MNLLPFGELSAYAPRHFVPAHIDLDDGRQVTPLFDQLEARAAQCTTAAELEQWLLDWSELRAAVDEEMSRRYIAMTCHTELPEAERAYLEFVERVEPLLKPRQFKLERIYLGHPLRGQLPAARYQVFERNTRQRVELFRPENVPRETEEKKLAQQYQKICGSLTVSFQGEERTVTQMGRYQEEPNRALRQETWELVVRRRLREAEPIESIFEQMLRLRSQIAAQAGYPNYMEYAFRERGRFDYTPADCTDFHLAVEQEVMPLLRQLQAERRQQLGLHALRPWDLKVDPLNRPPLRPFEQADQLSQGAQQVFDRLDGELASQFRLLQERRLLDLANRKGKAPGGYQCTLAEARLPFIFMNAVGMQRDVETLLHEAGHAFHALAIRPENLYAYRDPPIEFCEVASMSMELLGNEFLDVFYPPEQQRRACRLHLAGIVEVLPWIATVDAFQHWLYTHPGHTRAERHQAWLRVMDRFEGDADWAGHEAARAQLWHRQLHLFLHPFYYVEYGIAQLGALQIWARARQDRSAALRDYRRALTLGGSQPLPELFAAAGCRLEFHAEAIRPLMALVRDELESLNV